ncbi:DNAJB12 protein [Schizosaccharomyces octosporus yFS286]|uniref:DNAJB12 protein n=1 Tax=Schizosaccharomyces octosporus (strain yFS286) TaxID=483514 RepID=S9R1M3_SCHOY|nr:DNAJB12 protein [Schizosaccharomyces octosporus yFS286]EPX72315.1 DNAJB12 protein [Schizosaccharomyces octosporus yFS286]
MEASREEALRCISLARKYLEAGDYQKASKFTDKSERILPTPEAKDFRTYMTKERTSNKTKPSAASTGTSNASSTMRDRTSNSPRSNDSSQASYTREQMEIVHKITKLKQHEYYEILNLKKDCKDIEIKKSYRKLALQLHPDKNHAPNADEAFKKVSKAFQVLSDPNMRAHYDRTGADPESRASASTSSFSQRAGPGFQGFSGYPQAQMSPEDLFNSFFGDQFFSGGPNTFFFGGPGVRVHQFGGRPRRYRRQQAEDTNNKSMLYQILPILILVIFAFLSNFTSSGDSSVRAGYSFVPTEKYSAQYISPKYKVPFYVNPKQYNSLSSRDSLRLANQIEQQYAERVHAECIKEREYKEDQIRKSYGWFFPDAEKLSRAKEISLPHCDEFSRLSYHKTFSNYYYY